MRDQFSRPLKLGKAVKKQKNPNPQGIAKGGDGLRAGALRLKKRFTEKKKTARLLTTGKKADNLSNFLKKVRSLKGGKIKKGSLS